MYVLPQIYTHKKEHKFLETGQGNQEIINEADRKEEREFWE